MVGGVNKTFSTFPVPEESFHALIGKYVNSTKGYMQTASKEIGYVRDRLIYFKISALSGIKRPDPTETIK